MHVGLLAFFEYIILHSYNTPPSWNLTLLYRGLLDIENIDEKTMYPANILLFSDRSHKYTASRHGGVLDTQNCHIGHTCCGRFFPAGSAPVHCSCYCSLLSSLFSLNETQTNGCLFRRKREAGFLKNLSATLLWQSCFERDFKNSFRVAVEPSFLRVR